MPYTVGLFPSLSKLGRLGEASKVDSNLPVLFTLIIIQVEGARLHYPDSWNGFSMCTYTLDNVVLLRAVKTVAREQNGMKRSGHNAVWRD